jgi:hypothetical protein
MQVSWSPVLQRNLSILEAAMGEDHVLFHPDTGLYCHLNDVGKDVWGILAAPHTRMELAVALSSRFAADQATCEMDTLAFLDKLAQAGFIRVAEPPVQPGQ